MKNAGWWATALVALAGCTDEYALPNLSPEVTALEYCQQDERTYVLLEVFDHERDPVDVSIDIVGVAACGADRAPMAIGPTGSGVSGLNSERADHPRAISGADAQLHRVEWAASGDEANYSCASEEESSSCCTLSGPAPTTVSLHIRATDNEQFAEWEWTGDVTLSEQPCDELMAADASAE